MSNIIVLYIFIIIDKADFLREKSIPCILVGYFAYSSALMAIFTLNAMAIDYFTSF